MYMYIAYYNVNTIFLRVLQNYQQARLEHDLNNMNYLPYYILKVRIVMFCYCYERNHL